ncbi:methylenetetrahydrofolate reductase [Leptospira sp. WS39.C2]
MNQILLEVVPRDVSVVLQEVNYVKNNFNQISGINIPDLLRFDNRSWAVASLIQPIFPNVIPHLRAIDFDLDHCEGIIETLKQSKISTVVGIKDEFDYIEMKKDAGADGFLTQPFFDMRLVDIFTEKLKGMEVYIGVSPVITEKSQSYWESRNRAYFPKDFKPNMEWNVKFAKEVISYCSKNGMNAYLMPIRINLEEYLPRVFR